MKSSKPNNLDVSRRFAFNILFVATMCCTSISGHAEQASSPITIEADHATLNEKKGISIYAGNVLLKQDDISFSADEIKVHSKAGKLSKVVATGSPVSFKQSNRGDKSITAVAQIVEFYADTKTVLLLENASLSQGTNKFAGNRIEYDIAKDTVTAGSTNKTPQQEGERVKVTIDPKRPITAEPNAPTQDKKNN